MLKKFFPIFLFLFSAACHDDRKEAQSYLNKAWVLYENVEYNSAKQVLDGIKERYPKEIGLQKECLHLMRQIELKEQERNLIFCDSLLIICQARADSLKTHFVFEKDPRYDAVGRYVEKKTAALLSSQKIQTGVNETGDIYLKSHYRGISPLRHNQLKIAVSSGEYAQTEIIPFDGGANYTFKDDNTGLIHEIVVYQRERDNGTILFICNHSLEKLTASYIGEKSYSFVLSQTEIESLKKSAEFSSVLLDIQKIQHEKTKAAERINYLQSKLNK